MARSIKDIKKSITDSFMSNQVIVSIYGLDTQKSFDDQFSAVSIERILFMIIATCQWTLEKLFDIHKEEITDIINQMKPHSLRWYANMAKAFQYGYNLVDEEDYYDNTGLTEDQIAASKIVAYSAVVEQENNLRIKIAKIDGHDLGPLDSTEKEAFDEYMSRVKDAGVRLIITSDEPDRLILELDIYYNPLVLDANGTNINDGSHPVEDAIHNYLKNLPFNGWFVLAYFIDALQEVEGVVIPDLKNAEAYYGQHVGGSIDVKYNPDAGYLRVDDDHDLHINWIPQSVIK